MNDGLKRFRDAQNGMYQTALNEIRSGRKRSHWMWYIFPQIQGLGNSSTSRYYAIQNLEEAKKYLKDPLLGPRLIEISEVVLQLHAGSLREIFGSPDDLKLISCMTLFEAADPKESIFAAVINKYGKGKRDSRTLAILRKQEHE